MDPEPTMRRLYELLTAGDVDSFGDLLADDFVEHEELPGLTPTKEGVIALFRMYIAAFPDLRMVPEDVLTSGDKAVARVRATGTHQGEFMGMSATGKAVDVQLIDIIRFGDDGLAREHWGVFDTMTMMQQLGAVPDGPPPRRLRRSPFAERQTSPEAPVAGDAVVVTRRAGGSLVVRPSKHNGMQYGREIATAMVEPLRGVAQPG